MSINDVIIRITNFSYQHIGNALPDEVDKSNVVNIFEQIINKSMDSTTPVEHPFMINVAGIPGAGKSTYCKKLITGKESFCNINFSNVLYIAFDEIMCNAQLPYKNEADLNVEQAFNRWEIPARIAGYELLKRAVDKKLNILFEHSSSIEWHVKLFELMASKYDYMTYFVYLNIDPDKAKTRVMERMEHENRRFTPELVDRRHAALVSLLPEYRKLFKSNFKE